MGSNDNVLKECVSKANVSGTNTCGVHLSRILCAICYRPVFICVRDHNYCYRSSFLEPFGAFSFCMNVTEEWFLPAHFPTRQRAIMKEQQPLTSSVSSSRAPCSPKHLSCVSSLNPHHIPGAGLWLPPFSWPVNWGFENSRSECQILPLKLFSIKANRVRFSIARMLPINCVCTCVQSSWLSQLQEKR